MQLCCHTKKFNNTCQLLIGITLIWWSCITQSCRPSTSENESTDVILAEVYDQKLTLDAVRPLLGDYATEEDSIALVRSQVETWVREILLLHEAENNIPVDVNINKLVSDYRASLLLSNYENVLIKTLLDTVVTEAELRAYYQRNKEQYQLEVPILRMYYVQLPKPIPAREQFNKLWKSDNPADLEALDAYCRQYAIAYSLEDSTWYRQPDVERLLPPGNRSGQNMSPDRALKFSDDSSEYYLRIRERILSKDIAPLSYVSEQARRFILHKRKIDLLEKIKADIYEREIKGDQVKINI